MSLLLAGVAIGWFSAGVAVALFIGAAVKVADAQDAVDLDVELKRLDVWA